MPHFTAGKGGGGGLQKIGQPLKGHQTFCLHGKILKIVLNVLKCLI